MSRSGNIALQRPRLPSDQFRSMSPHEDTWDHPPTALRLSRLEVGDHEPPRHDTEIRPLRLLTAVMHARHTFRLALEQHARDGHRRAA
jgi:hypothetical protein